MLRITVLKDVGRATFKMEGKLTDEWVTEAAKTWAEFASAAQQERVVVDLCGVSFVDDPGRELLARMHSSGAKLIGTGPMTGALIEEICGGKRSPPEWIRSALSLFLLFLLATVMPGHRNSFHCRRVSPSEDAPSAIQGRIVPIHHPPRYTSVPGR